MSKWTTSFLIIDSPFKGRNFTQHLILLDKLYQGGELSLEDDSRNDRVGKRNIASHERSIVRQMEIRCEGEKEG
jgi:hypothetical protein